MTITSIGDINRELANRCRSLDLALHCPADGIFGAEIAIIADYPGEREQQTKLPLSGSGGKLLWDQLRPIGLTRRNVYSTHAIKRRVGQSANGEDKVHRHEADHYFSILQWELQQLPNLKHIVVLGNYALEAITGLSGIGNCRGSVYSTLVQSISQDTSRECSVVVLMSPSEVVRQPKWEIMFKHDVRRLDAVIHGRFKQHIIEPIINPSPKEALQFIDKMQDERLPVSIDIEVIGGETACIGLANNPHTGMCINFRDRTSNTFTVSEEREIRLRLAKWKDDPNIKVVMQNGMFDTSWLWYKDRLLLPRSFFDTMLAHHTLYPQLPHGLGFLTSQYTTHPFYKDEGKAWREGGNINEFWEYNVKDACITWAAYEKMQKELEDQGLAEFFFSHVMRLQPHLIQMTVGGVLADGRLMKKIADDTRAEVDRLKELFWQKVEEATGEPGYRPNPKSPKQMSELYFRKLRLVGRGTATDEKNRARMRAHPRTPVVAREMLDAQDALAKEQKFLSTYADMRIDEDGRIRCEYKQTGVAAAPGRLSSAGTLWGSGTNLQNQPGRAHQMFVADSGYCFIYFDQSQAEARVVGWKYDIESWIEQFERAREGSGYDAHRALAADMFHVPYDEVPKEDWDENGNPTIRYKAKRCRHGLNYRMGPDRLAEELEVSLSEATELWNIYHRITPELQRGWDATVSEVQRTGRLYNAYGRRWILLERFDDEALKSVVAFYPQSTIGDKVSRCIYLCHDDPDWPTGYARMALNIHDALIAICKIGYEDQAIKVMKRHAEAPVTIESISGKKRELIIPSDFKISKPDEHGVHRWSTLEKVKLVA